MFYKLWWYKKQLEGFELEDIKDIKKIKHKKRGHTVILKVKSACLENAFVENK